MYVPSIWLASKAALRPSPLAQRLSQPRLIRASELLESGICAAGPKACSMSLDVQQNRVLGRSGMPFWAACWA